MFCILVWRFSSIPQYREWARVAFGFYAAGAALTLLARDRIGVRTRTIVAMVVLAGAALLPLTLEVRWRAETTPGSHAQSEVLVTEEAARALAAGVDPYRATYLQGPLAARPPGTKTHFPYLPGMLAFGMPRAWGGDRPVADARVFFAGTALVLAVAALAKSRVAPGRALVAFQALAVFPTGALLAATGGDDLPVLALTLLALVCLSRRRPVAAGLAAGAAAALKQTAWPLLPFLVMAGRRTAGRPARRSIALAAAGVLAAVVVPFVLWDPAAFLEDVIRFPLGLGTHATPADSPTLGRALGRAFPGARTVIAVAVIAAVAGFVLYLMIRRAPRTAAGVAASTGTVLGVAFVLAPAARFGYLVYPVDLLVWAWALGPGPPGPASRQADRLGP